MDATRPPLGHVTRGDSARYELLDLHHWRVTVNGRDDPMTASNLAMLYAPSADASDEAAYGRMVLDHLAKRVGGRAVFPEPGE